MIILFLVSCVALMLTFLASKDKVPLGLEIAFFLVSFVAAIHYNYGNDYMTYFELFEEFSKYDFDLDLLVNKKIYKEPGWFLVNYMFAPLGFYSLVVFLSAVQNFIYYLFIKKYVPKNWWVMGMFIYLFSNSLYVLNMSMMRQGLAVSLFVLAWILLDSSKKYLMLVSVILVYFASTIHSSAIVLLPCLLIIFLNKKSIRYYGYGAVFLFVLFYVKPDLVNTFFLSFADMEDVQRLLSKYDDSASNLSYGIGFVLMMVPFMIMFYSLMKNDGFTEKELKIIAVAVLAYNIMPFRQSIPMVGRMAYYFTAFSIPAIPIAYKKIPYPYNFFAISGYILLILFEYWTFFTSESYSKSFMVFHSVFEIMF